ncbi:trypco2 family protein [Streptomyces sp.]|uniref:trypco2 family protein n=1 Tax=Streptomyces sp. TaxID=1931 RepID=UPI002F95570C
MLELADMIRELRSELIAATTEGSDRAVRFELGPVEIEATVAVSREAGGGGKVKFWVVEAGADGKYGQAATQRITLTLHPKAVTADGATRAVLISGDEAADER